MVFYVQDKREVPSPLHKSFLEYMFTCLMCSITDWLSSAMRTFLPFFHVFQAGDQKQAAAETKLRRTPPKHSSAEYIPAGVILYVLIV